MGENSKLRGCSVFFAILLGFATHFLPVSLLAQESPKVVNGRYTLKESLLEEGEFIELRGDWKFKWIDEENLSESYQNVPQAWTNYQVNGQAFPVKGRAVYECLIDNPDHIDNLSVHLFSISTSYKVWINGELMCANGVFSQKGIAVRSRDIVDFPKGQESFHIEILVDNHEHFTPGLNQSPIIASKAFMHRNEKLRANLEMLQLGALLLMALYHLVLYFQLQKLAYLLMSLLCLIVLVRSTVVFDGSLILYELIPALDFNMAKKVEYVAVYSSIFLPIMFVRSLFETKRFLIATRLFQIVGGAMILLVLFTPATLFGGTLDFFHWMFTAGFIVVFIVLFYAIKEKKQGAIIVSLGVVVSFFFVFLEILRNSGFGSVSNLGPNFVDTGVVGFLFFQTIAISSIFAKAFRENQKFSKELGAMVEQRTEQLSKSNVVKDQLFSIISHDLKSPLNSLKGMMTLVELGGLTKEEEKGLFRQINQSLSSTLGLLDNLLSWATSQMTGKQSRLITERFDLYDVLQENIQQLGDVAQRKSIQIKNTSTKLNWVEADKNMLKMVVRNLLNNSIKFTPKGGKIVLDVIKGKDHYIVSVKDNGIGMPEEILKNLFDFSTKSRQGTQEEKGNGIGLMLCKDLVEQNGGKIWAESDQELGGSIFKFTVPYHK